MDKPEHGILAIANISDCDDSHKFRFSRFKFPVYLMVYYNKLISDKELSMKVFLLQNVEKIGIAGEIIKVSDGYAQNFLLPKKLAVEITPFNEELYKKKIKQVENRKEVIASKTSMLAEKISTIKITLKRKMHDDGKLYGSISSAEIVDALAEKGVSVGKSQIELDKSIKAKGTYSVTIALSSKLKPAISLTVVPE